MKIKLTCALLATVMLLVNCGEPTREEADYDDGGYNEVYGYEDGTYCADVEYYYSETGTRNSYTLEVEIESNQLVKIYWPNGGWLDDSHFETPDISDGSASFTSDRRVDYEVSINGKGGTCWESDYVKTEDDLIEDYEDEERRDHTCTHCGAYSYDLDDELCQNCKNDVTCPQCGSDKERYDDVCSSCEYRQEQEKREEEQRAEEEEEERRKAEDE